MLIKVEFSSFALDPAGNTPLVILKEANGDRMLPLPVGPLEASAIAMKTLDVTTEKPLTIDVAKCILEELCGSLTRVIIEPDTGGSLMARLEITAHETLRKVTCRASDAVAPIWAITEPPSQRPRLKIFRERRYAMAGSRVPESRAKISRGLAA